MGFWYPLFIWVYMHAQPWVLIQGRRASARKMAKRRGVACQGVFRTHAAVDIFEGIAACGAFVQSYSGPASDANCRACKRIIKRADRIGAGDE